MITHDLVIMGLEVIKKNSTNKVDIAIIDDAIELIKRGGEVERDVKRYFELSHNPKTNTNPSEMRPYIEWAEELTDLELHILSKVGNEE